MPSLILSHNLIFKIPLKQPNSKIAFVRSGITIRLVTLIFCWTTLKHRIMDARDSRWKFMKISASLLKHPENLALHPYWVLRKKKLNVDKNETEQISCRNGPGRIKIMTHHFHKYGGRRQISTFWILDFGFGKNLWIHPFQVFGSEINQWQSCWTQCVVSIFKFL